MLTTLQRDGAVTQSVLAADQKTHVVFQSRYRSFVKVLKTTRVGKDDAGHGQYETVEAQFRGGMLTIPSTPENQEKIALLRAGVGPDYIEINLTSTKTEVAKRDQRILDLEAEVKKLKAQQDPTIPVVKVGRPRKTPTA